MRALVLEARGPAFCAGYDLAQLGEDAAAARSPDARILSVPDTGPSVLRNDLSGCATLHCNAECFGDQ